MPDPIPACFRGGGAGGPPLPNPAGPSLTTVVYETPLGLAALTWCRTVLGLSLRAVLRLEDGNEEPLRFHIRPWLLWKRRGSRRFRFKDLHGHRRSVDFTWNLTRAIFPSGGGPEPAARFFVAVAFDGEMLLVAGDLSDEAYRKTKARQPSVCPALISRLEHVVLADGGGGNRRPYRTRVHLGGRDREISIELEAKEKGKESAMSVAVDGERVLRVRRIQWKFRGSERVELDGSRIHFSWDLHNWLFQPKENPSASSGSAELGHAVFVLRFEGQEKPQLLEEHFGNSMCKSLVTEGYNGKTWNTNWSWSSGGSGGGERRAGRKKSIKKMSSSSSSSSASSGNSSVMEWASPEDLELQRTQGFSLLVYAWKS